MTHPLTFALRSLASRGEYPDFDTCGLCETFEKVPLPSGVLVCPHCDDGHTAHSCSVCYRLFS